MLTCAVMTGIGFLSGSIMYSCLLPKWLLKVDIREQCEDGNPGGMNAIASSGFAIGLICVTLDILKAAAPVYYTAAFLQMSGYHVIPVMIAPVLGHAFSPFLGFRGGKAVAAAFGVLLGAIGFSNALVMLALIMIFFRFIVVLNPDSTKVIVVFSLASLAVLMLEPLIEMKIAMLIISAVVCGKNLANPNNAEPTVSIGSFEISREENHVKVTRRNSQ